MTGRSILFTAEKDMGAPRTGQVRGENFLIFDFGKAFAYKNPMSSVKFDSNYSMRCMDVLEMLKKHVTTGRQTALLRIHVQIYWPDGMLEIIHAAKKVTGDC
jgi:hypothetical protein